MTFLNLLIRCNFVFIKLNPINTDYPTLLRRFERNFYDGSLKPESPLAIQRFSYFTITERTNYFKKALAYKSLSLDTKLISEKCTMMWAYEKILLIKGTHVYNKRRYAAIRKFVSETWFKIESSLKFHTAIVWYGLKSITIE